MTLTAPFPWFGGKRRVAHLVWPRFGDVPNYVEPFAGSLAVLLARPHQARCETVNDLDCYVANFWRAMQADPEAVAQAADWPVNEADLHARHRWLVDQAGFRERMRSDPEYFDAKIAGWWVWGVSQWIGQGWCAAGSRAEALLKTGQNGKGIHAKRVQLGRGGRGGRGSHGGQSAGWNQRPDVSTSGRGMHSTSEKMPRMDRGGTGVDRRSQMPDISGDGGAYGRGVHASAKQGDTIRAWFTALADRLRRVRVCCGDWSRILGPSPTVHIGTTAVFLDPPYGADRADCYAEDSRTVAGEVLGWCKANGDNPRLRIALCGYVGEHDDLEAMGWGVLAWRAPGGYAGQKRGGASNGNNLRERIWFSPHCLRGEGLSAQQQTLEGVL